MTTAYVFLCLCDTRASIAMCTNLGRKMALMRHSNAMPQSMAIATEPFHDFAAQPSNRELAADLPRLRKHGIPPHQVVDRLARAPAKQRQERVERKNF